MISGKFAPDYSLAKLRDMFNIYEGIWGPLLAIDNDGTDTVGTFDETLNGTQKLTLRPGSPSPLAGETTVANGMVFILGSLQTVTVYRT